MGITLSKAIFSFVLVSICAFALVGLTGTPADALVRPIGSNCPPPCQSIPNVYLGVCDRITPECHEVCTLYTSSNGVCYKDCYAL